MSKKRSLRTPKIPKLEPIIYDERLSAFELRHYVVVNHLKLVLADYDWCNYELSADMSTKEYGDLKVKFEYYGMTVSTMIVETEEEKYSFQFNTNIFQEHIINFLKSHINSWSEPGEFRGIQEFIYFYNDVLISPDTVEEGKQPIRRRRY